MHRFSMARAYNRHIIHRFGMAHRGSIKAVANVFQKKLQRIFAEFQ